jgi:hypothetical protein
MAEDYSPRHGEDEYQADIEEQAPCGLLAITVLQGVFEPPQKALHWFPSLLVSSALIKTLDRELKNDTHD